MLYVWIALMLLLLGIEAATAQLTTIWFALGALAAAIVAATTANHDKTILMQVLVFVVVSALALAATRPLVKKFTLKKVHRTNADRNIGEKALVTETINNIEGKGAVKVKGIVWTARNVSDCPVEAGGYVEIVAIEGAKLIVKASPAEEICVNEEGSIQA